MPERKNSQSKGQLISEWLVDVLIFSKRATQTFGEFLPKNLKSGQSRNKGTL